jgi:beta-N-acetylhexosaminidase
MIERIGQIMICGFDTPEPSDEFLEFVRAENIGGVILFEENANPHIMAESSIKSIISAGSVIPFIAVAQEGGRVCRFRGAPAEFDAPSEYGRLADLELFAEQFGRAAYYLHSIGINLFFGPVADLRINPENRCLEGRTFGSNPARVIPFIEKAIKIANRAGILSCLKHFPGFGAAVGVVTGRFGQVARQAAQPRPHLQHDIVARDIGIGHDLRQSVLVGEEVLPQAFFGAQMMLFEKRGNFH